jgi:hypothetical protein
MLVDSRVQRHQREAARRSQVDAPVYGEEKVDPPRLAGSLDGVNESKPEVRRRENIIAYGAWIPPPDTGSWGLPNLGSPAPTVGSARESRR